MSYLRLVRPKQWIKQGFVFLPLISLGEQFSLGDFLLGLYAMTIFTAIAGSVYVYNDFTDIEFDRIDTIRRQRPLASGQVQSNYAVFLALTLLIGGLILCFLVSVSPVISLGLIFVYLFTNYIYSRFRLKESEILGIALVGFGFPLRFTFGCSFVGIEISYWAITLLMFLALFMLSIKRFQISLRSALEDSNSRHEFWLIAGITFAAFFSSSYAGFVSSPATQEVWGSTTLLISSVPVALGIVRFIQLGTDKGKINSGDVTEDVARDLPILGLSFAYALIMLLGRMLAS
jgi:decaprenyl-phosphate phosphoribosyltransferase